MKKGQMETRGSMAPGLFVPDRDIDATPSYAVWPNKKNTKRVSDRSSMVGAHQITGDGVPASLQFELTQNADFMPKIALQSRGEPTDAIAVNWQPVDRARAYFLTGTGIKSEHEFVMWSSAEVAGASSELLNYLTGSYIDKWLKQKVLLPSTSTSCTVPKGIFAGSGGGGGGEMGGMGMLTMIAYGPETNIVYPPKPADPKQPWNPEWNVRVRTKSTAFAMLGLDMGDMQEDDGEGQQQQGQGCRCNQRTAQVVQHLPSIDAPNWVAPRIQQQGQQLPVAPNPSMHARGRHVGVKRRILDQGDVGDRAAACHRPLEQVVAEHLAFGQTPGQHRVHGADMKQALAGEGPFAEQVLVDLRAGRAVGVHTVLPGKQPTDPQRYLTLACNRRLTPAAKIQLVYGKGVATRGCRMP